MRICSRVIHSLCEMHASMCDNDASICDKDASMIGMDASTSGRHVMDEMRDASVKFVNDASMSEHLLASSTADGSEDRRRSRETGKPERTRPASKQDQTRAASQQEHTRLRSQQEKRQEMNRICTQVPQS